MPPPFWPVLLGFSGHFQAGPVSSFPAGEQNLPVPFWSLKFEAWSFRSHCTICGIFSMTAVANSVKDLTIQGRSKRMTASTARALGAKVMVCS